MMCTGVVVWRACDYNEVLPFHAPDPIWYTRILPLGPKK